MLRSTAAASRVYPDIWLTFCLFSSEQAVQVLLEYGAKDAGSTGWHCILLAAERGHTQV
jgi:hypothetical protein